MGLLEGFDETGFLFDTIDSKGEIIGLTYLSYQRTVYAIPDDDYIDKIKKISQDNGRRIGNDFRSIRENIRENFLQYIFQNRCFLQITFEEEQISGYIRNKLEDCIVVEEYDEGSGHLQGIFKRKKYE